MVTSTRRRKLVEQAGFRREASWMEEKGGSGVSGFFFQAERLAGAR